MDPTNLPPFLLRRHQRPSIVLTCPLIAFAVASTPCDSPQPARSSSICVFIIGLFVAVGLCRFSQFALGLVLS